MRIIVVIVLLAMPVAIVAALSSGLVPPRMSPFAPVELAEPDNWFIDVRLAALRRDQSICRAVLAPPFVNAKPVEDRPLKDGCGWSNAVRLRGLGGAGLSSDKITCEMAAALALWIAHDVQPAAITYFGQRVTSVETFGAYACRNIIGDGDRDERSQHATANAIDISGFTLADGTNVTVARHWNGPPKQSGFLRQVHKASCRVFRTSLGPDYNEAHRDHFHLDRGPLSLCR